MPDPPDSSRSLDSNGPADTTESRGPQAASETNESRGPGAASETCAASVDRAAVRDRLNRVHDPELDRSIVELEYVDHVEIDGGSVTVTFVLPTAWCSPAFAWMMATGIRDEVESLPGVSSVSVKLVDHMHGDQISAGVNERASFESVFEDADDGIDAVRRKLDEKARFARQHAAIETLREAGLDPGQIATLAWADVDLDFGPDLAAISLHDGSLTVTVARDPLAEYVEKAQETGLVTDETDRVFADREGTPLHSDRESFETVLRAARLASANIDGQATICEALHESRNGVTLD